MRSNQVATGNLGHTCECPGYADAKLGQFLELAQESCWDRGTTMGGRPNMVLQLKSVLIPISYDVALNKAVVM